MSRYFSNGTEGYAWMAEWCDRCDRDHSMHSPDGESGCEIIARSMLGDDEVIPEWVDHSDTEGFTFPPAVHCLMFSPCQACNPGDGGPERPKGPQPIPGDQRLFDMPEHHLMWAVDQFAETPVEVRSELLT